ncbi:hypothetical protein ONZ43_g660 [Nemania bipapillata]|uniref:Uncharacterized protein n=1 Tax=Nemania bipapillata TaxID=110536 RepID=A0ACC2J7P5_9PEZI|nr:hypothetical protein ONZ43_g660 [Nemania bipapillata]
MGDSPSSSTVWTVTQVQSGLTGVITSTGRVGGVNAYGVKVGFQSTDFVSSTTTTTKKTTTKTTTAQAKTTTTGTTHVGSSGSTSSSSTSHKKKGSSSGVITGIVIGVLAAVSALIGAIVALVRKRRQKAEAIPQEDEPEKHELGTGNENAAELDAGEIQPSMHSSPMSQPSHLAPGMIETHRTG